MNDSKPLLYSKTVWAQILGIVATVALAYGVEIDAASQEQILTTGALLFGIGAQVWGVVARKQAKTEIKGIFKSPKPEYFE